MVLKLAGVADEATGGEEGLDEVDNAVGTAVLPLTVGQDPVEASPFRGLPGVVIESSVLERPRDLISRPTFSQ